MDRNRIIMLYRGTVSIKAVSRVVGISHQTVRRVLVEAGEYKSARSEEIGRLLDSGLSHKQIADQLGIGLNAVISYAPYTKGSYLMGDKTVNARRIAKTREKKMGSQK